ncbi:synaptonemal complex central element protein 1-like isoform X1 [Falco rusticolus]|uniref:synaptonemal complex central element protein 1-like isoform X1 n=1 Tax=Falco rusticolus TaxID=120794 RepID=UPI00188685CA|nr:synaptonemal complex central element protein 1-like isoform X1 [Falco rusticolus]
MKWSKVEEEEGGRYMREDEGPACGCHCHLCPLRLWRWTVTHRVRALVAVSPPHTWVFPHPRDTGVTVCLSPASLVSPGVQRWLDVLVGRVCSLHQAHLATAQELAAAQEHGEGLRQQQEQLEERQAALEGLWQQKQEELRGAQLRREEVEAKGQRCRGLCLGCQQDLERMEQELERLRRLRRGYRQDFGQQLDAIMEEHKHLQEAHAPAQLEAELVQLEEAREKLLRQERHLLEIEKQLGPEAHVAMQLVQQEQARAQQRLEAELERRQRGRGRRDRLAEELERLQRPLEASTE